jgi:CelD/BcsL family acetyltransferase involved in cellulose biosynthesis
VCRPADAPTALTALAGFLRGERFADLLVAENLPAELEGPRHLDGRLIRTIASPVLPVRGRSFDDYLSERSRNFRDQVRRRERGLERDHELRYRLTTGPATLDRDLDTLFSLHGARWQGRRLGEFSAADAAFHRDFARSALDRGWLRLWTMEIDGAAVAAWYGFRFGDAEWYYQAGRDPAYDDRSVGFVLLAHTIRAAFEDGVREYRFLRGDEPYKRRFAERDAGVETIAVARGLRGRALLAALALGAKLR